MPLRAVLFDLDDTLFDHSFATARALATLHAQEPGFSTWPLDRLAERHSEILEEIHAGVLAGRLTIEVARAERFRRLLNEASGADVPSAQAQTLARVYRAAYESAWQPASGARPLLTAVRAAGWRTAIVTNNLVAEQRDKLQRCGLSDLIDALVTSEETGAVKPDIRIFQHALERVGVQPDDAVMIGDAWPTDIEGALSAGIRPIWLNRRSLPRPRQDVMEIRALEPLADVMAAIRS